jgi:hypothetical protein
MGASDFWRHRRLQTEESGAMPEVGFQSVFRLFVHLHVKEPCGRDRLYIIVLVINILNAVIFIRVRVK